MYITLLWIHMKWEICTQHVVDYYLAMVWRMPNLACCSYLYLMIGLDAYIYSMLRWSVLDYYTRKTWLQVMGLGLVHRKDHRTWGLYTNYTICMSPILLHDVWTICTISSYELGTILCLIVIVNMKLYFLKILVGYFVCWHHYFLFVSSHFCRHCILVSLQLMMLQLNRGCSLP